MSENDKSLIQSSLTEIVTIQNTDPTCKENNENSLMWFAHLYSQFGSINNTFSSHPNYTFSNESISTEVTQSLLSCPVNAYTLRND